MNTLEVVFCGWGQEWTLGTLAQSGHRLPFEYSQEALTRGVKFSALKVPLKAQTYADFPAHLGGLPVFVADALPAALTPASRRLHQAGG